MELTEVPPPIRPMVRFGRGPLAVWRSASGPRAARAPACGVAGRPADPEPIPDPMAIPKVPSGVSCSLSFSPRPPPRPLMCSPAPLALAPGSSRAPSPSGRPGSPERRPGRFLGRARMVLLLLAGGLTACGPSVPQKTVEILRILPTDPDAYTQGLVLDGNVFFESTGTYGGSTLREVEVETGEILRLHRLPDDHFGEGLALVGDRLIQLTWQEGIAWIYDRESFEVVGRFEYQGNGWGLCYDGEDLWMTTGGSLLVRRDPITFEVRERVPVTLRDRPQFEVNELACVGDHIYGNIFQEDRIVKIEKATGVIVAEIDASPLNPQSGRPLGDPEAVLNGIAWDPETDTFYLTGKRWPTIFQVRFTPSPRP